MADENIVIPGPLDQEHEQHKVRLSGIDVPGKSQPFGQQAKKSLSELAYGRSVFVEWRKRDGYRLIVGKVFEGGRGVNLEQVRRGLAWRYQQYQNEQDALDRASYATAETVRRARRDAACGRCRKPKGCTRGAVLRILLDQ